MESYSRLTQDHKPSSESETHRIRRLAADNGVDAGSVLQLPGEGKVARVCGLAVSRSIGARYAFPYVIPNPDVSEVQVRTLE